MVKTAWSGGGDHDADDFFFFTAVAMEVNQQASTSKSHCTQQNDHCYVSESWIEVS